MWVGNNGILFHDSDSCQHIIYSVIIEVLFATQLKEYNNIKIM